MAAFFPWLVEARNVLKNSSWGPYLDVRGIDAVEVLANFLHLAALHDRRQPGLASPGPVQRMAQRLRLAAYRLKMALRERRIGKYSASATPANILLWPCDPTHIAGHIPLAAALSSRGAKCSFLASDHPTFQNLQACGTKAVFTRAAWPSIVGQARREGFRQARRLARATVPELPQFAGPQGAVMLEPVVRRTLIELLPFVHEAIANAIAALDRFQPEALIVGNDLTIEGRSGALVARSRGVTTVALMHGIIGGGPQHQLHCVDRFFVYGNAHRRELVARGIDPQRIGVCGAPYLDDHPRQTGIVHPALRDRLGIQPGTPWVLVATSGPGHSISHAHHQSTLDHVMRLSAKMPQVTFVAKLHRKDNPRYYRQAEKSAPNSGLKVIAHGTPGFPENIFDWLQGCRIVLTGASAVAVEAMLMGVPVITMDFRDEIHGVDFIEAGASTHVTNAAELEVAVAKSLDYDGNDPRQQNTVREFLDESFGALDGHSADRIAAAILQLGQPSSHVRYSSWTPG